MITNIKMKTNVSSKFNSIEEYREIEKKLIELGYSIDKEYNEQTLTEFESYNKIQHYIRIYEDYICVAGVFNDCKVYNSLEEFLNDFNPPKKTN